ncbi:hypothetical protein C8N47_107224, partial [Mangrovibacterium marinum]
MTQPKKQPVNFQMELTGCLSYFIEQTT